MTRNVHVLMQNSDDDHSPIIEAIKYDVTSHDQPAQSWAYRAKSLPKLRHASEALHAPPQFSKVTFGMSMTPPLARFSPDLRQVASRRSRKVEVPHSLAK